MAIWTNAGINLVASAVQSPSASCAITYVDVAPGCGTLATGLTLGNMYTSLTLNAGLPVALAGSASLTITDGVNTQLVTVVPGGASQGATTINLNSFTASATFAANTTGVCPTPLVGDVALYNGSAAGIRVSAAVGTAGAQPGESLNAGYFDGTQATSIYLLVGYFGGSTATSTPGTGTLMIEDVQFWNHTVNVDTNMFQADDTI